MASNAFNNVASISKMAMDCLENNLTFTKFVNRQYDDQFRADGAKNGDSCNIRIPGSYSTRSGSVANPQGYNDTLSQRNDTAQRNPFKRIAAHIEKEPEGLFVD